MRLAAPFLSVISVMCLTVTSAFAGEAEYQVTNDFMDVCGADFTDISDLNSRFTAEGWEMASETITEALRPDDFLRRVKNLTGYEVVYENGASWYGVAATGKLGRDTVVFCGVTAIDDDPDGYRQDFEKASELELERVASNEVEERFAVESGANIYVMRELRSSDSISYFTYIKVSPAKK